MNNADQSHLLVVDDNEMNRDMLSRRLSRAGYQVAVAEDGNQALEMLQTQPFDLVLLDVNMPVMSGFEVLQHIRQRRTVAELPVIMVTARNESCDVVEGFKLGANDYLAKPIDFPILLARLQTQLQLRMLTQLKDEFMQIASHDLKNPLGNVLMAAAIVLQVIKPGDTMTEEMYETLKFVSKHGDEMKRIITDFLDFHAIKDGQLQLQTGPVNLNEIARQIAESNAEYAQSKHIHIHLALDEQLPSIPADPARLAQVIHNFVSNAIKFCPDNATVVLRTGVQDDCVLLEVADTGPGLTDADLAKTFVKYARLSNKPTGGEKSSGLGLAICKQMIELHGGTIGVRNNPDRGAIFWFSLPLSSHIPVSTPPAVENRSALSLAGTMVV